MQHDRRPSASTDDRVLAMALRSGNEAAFVSLLDRYHAALVRVAMMYVPNRAEAEEIAQETWIGVFRGIDRFEGRSSLSTWIYRILINQAKQRRRRADQSIPFSALWDAAGTAPEAAVDIDRFFPSEHERAGRWMSPPRSWEGNPEERMLAGETRTHIMEAVDGLPPDQREVVLLRDVEGWTAAEVCTILELSAINQRVLLHRGRSRVRRTLEIYLEGA